MENAFHEFTPVEGIDNINDKINYLSEFNSNSLRELEVNEEVHNHLSAAIEANKRMIYRFEYESPFTKQKIVSDDPFIVQDLAIQDLKASELFSDDEINLIQRVRNLFDTHIYVSFRANSIPLLTVILTWLTIYTLIFYFIQKGTVKSTEIWNRLVSRAESGAIISY